MNDTPPVPRRGPGEADAPPDAEYSRGYADGFGDGLRTALRDVLQHVARGLTAQELRFLVESRLARVAEEIELKRKSLLAPPRRIPLGPVARPPSPFVAPHDALYPARAEAGSSHLFLEDRPRRAAAFAIHNALVFRQRLAISRQPPELPRGGWLSLRPVAPSAAEDATRATLSGLGGRLQAACSARPTLGYVAGFDFLVTEYGPEPVLKFAFWLADLARRTAGCVVASVAPEAFSTTDRTRLQRAFAFVR